MNNFDDGSKEQEKVMNSYKKRGFVKTKQDEDSLHMAFSPNRVPKGLTKLQVRRRINKYLKEGNKNTLKNIVGNRLEVFVNGQFRLGATFGGKVPVNRKSFHKLLKNLFIK
jgi:hypothetical protein